ncbi:MAG: methyltransferase [Bacteroidales bacterium]|nr:methyltransferase [Bacteroidales bacterium]
MAFRFQQFTVEDTRSTMKVGTDALLLGALTNPEQASRILDIGTGCGVLALMMAQKSKAIIDAIEMDEDSVTEASENFDKSPWNNRLACFGISLQLVEFLTDHRYNLIISNPPFFKNSLKPPGEKKRLAKHDRSLSIDELLNAVSTLLNKHGRFSFIIPADRWDETRKLAGIYQLYPLKLVRIYPYPGGKATRIVAELTPEKPDHIDESELTILNEERKFSQEYLDATKEFHYF